MDRLEQYDTFALPVAGIWYDEEFNCRGPFTIQSVESLAKNIAQRGLAIPLIVQPARDAGTAVPEGKQWRIVAGHRRFVAMTTFLKATEVPCRIEAGLSHEEAALLNLTENLERKDLNPVEEARGLARLFPEPTSLRTISEAVKRDSKWVHQRLRLLRLPDAVQQMIADGRLRLLDIEVLANLPTAAAQIDAATKIATERGRHGRRANRALAPHLRRRFRGVRTKHEISRQIGRLLGAGMVGLITRFGAWCAGYISDEEWNSDLQAEILRRRAAKGIEKIGAHLFSDSASEPAR